MTDEIKAQLSALEKTAAALEPDAQEREQLRQAVVRYTEQFLDDIDDLDKSPAFYAEGTGHDLLNQPIGEDPVSLGHLIKSIAENVDRTGLNPASGGDLGYIPGGGIYSASLGDYWADITNRYAGIFFANPGAVRMENQLINWMKALTGYPNSALGNIASGGSIANLIAIVAARDAHKLSTKDIAQRVIYLSRQAHHCIDKAIAIAGVKECQFKYIDIDARYKIDVDQLESTIRKDIEAGLKPWLLVGSAGTTDTGAVDPLERMADVAGQYGLWFHIDAAYGGFFTLTDYGRRILKGIDRSDSVVMDPHKGLFLPYGIGIVLVKNGEHLRKSFAYEASYMQDTANLADEISPAEVSPELTKHFRGLRMWLPLMAHGVKPFRAALEEKLMLSQYAYAQLSKVPHVALGPEPELSVIIFRFVPPAVDADIFNRELLKKIHEDGRIFLSSTTINGTFFIRFAILSFRTHLKEIDLAIKIITQKKEAIRN